MTTAKQTYEKAVEQKTGLSINQIRCMSICELRTYFERKNGKPMQYSMNAPELISREEINRQIDEILFPKKGLLARVFGR
ncbi:hypothetical protein JXB27_01655 [Candidatus Woesearchaeota archaeon]|nr:hypothetical protein [Candidatus Woesearchaeota archaeon]